MNETCPQVNSLSAVLDVLKLQQNCRWTVLQGVELVVLCGTHGRELMLNLYPPFQAPGIFQRLLRRRAQHPDYYDGCYLCLNSENILSCWYQLREEGADDKHQIAQLFQLAGIEPEVWI